MAKFESIGARLIAAERARQVLEEGFDHDHDRRLPQHALRWAAICYAAPGKDVRQVFRTRKGERYEDPWPFDEIWDKRGRHGNVRQLAIAGALLAAEIDRLQRAGEMMPDVDFAEAAVGKTGEFATYVANELARARGLHGDQRSAHEAYAVILEEVEEFKAEVFKRREDRSTARMLAELVQIAAMAQRAAEDLGLIAR